MAVAGVAMAPCAYHPAKAASAPRTRGLERPDEVRGLPFHADVAAFVGRHQRVYVVEQNRDGQMADLLRLERPELAGRIRSVLHMDGLPIDAKSVVDEILRQERTGAKVAEGANV